MSSVVIGSAPRLAIQRVFGAVQEAGDVLRARRPSRPRGIELARAMRTACEVLATARARRELPSSPVICARCGRDYQCLLADCDSVSRTGMCGFCALPEVDDVFRKEVLREDAQYRACASALAKLTREEVDALGVFVRDGVLCAVEDGRVIRRVASVGGRQP